MPLFRMIYRESYNDKVKAESTIQNSNLEWIIVRAAGLNNAEPTGEYTAGIKSKIHFIMLPFADCAKCLLDALGEASWTRQIINVGKK